MQFLSDYTQSSTYGSFALVVKLFKIELNTWIEKIHPTILIAIIINSINEIGWAQHTEGHCIDSSSLFCFILSINVVVQWMTWERWYMFVSYTVLALDVFGYALVQVNFPQSCDRARISTSETNHWHKQKEEEWWHASG